MGGEDLQTFSLSESIREVPPDILQQVRFFSGGGGGECRNEDDVLFNGVVENLGTFLLLICGWQPGETVTFTISGSGGEVYSEKVVASEAASVPTYYASLFYEPSLKDEPGTYTVRAEGDRSPPHEYSFRIVAPDGPRWTLVGSSDNQVGLLLYNFQPHERVRLFYYTEAVSEVAQFVGWQPFLVNAQGQLVVQVEGWDPNTVRSEFAAVGDESGEASAPDHKNLIGAITQQGAATASTRVAATEIAFSTLVAPTSPAQPLPTSPPLPPTQPAPVAAAPTSVPPTVPPVVPTHIPTCAVAVHPLFESVWRQAGGVAASCPVGSLFTRAGAYQPFENGLMVWVAGETGERGGMIYIITQNGDWQEYRDTWDESQPSRVGLLPPSGLIEPQRGFGKVWREQLGGASAALGWALQNEAGVEVVAQRFEGTGIILSFNGKSYFLPHGRRWVGQ